MKLPPMNLPDDPALRREALRAFLRSPELTDYLAYRRGEWKKELLAKGAGQSREPAE